MEKYTFIIDRNISAKFRTTTDTKFKSFMDETLGEVYKGIGLKGTLSECAGICTRTFWEYERRDNEIIGLA